MQQKSLLLSAALFVALPSMALADDQNFFVGLDLIGGIGGGTSSTKDGGAPFALGGIVEDVKFGATTGLGGTSATGSMRPCRPLSAISICAAM